MNGHRMNFDFFGGSIFGIDRDLFQCVQDVETVDDLSKDGMTAVQPVGPLLFGGDEELGSIGIGSGVGHA